MTHTLLVAGTASHVGKSTVAAGLCRLLADRGVSVAPFKAQNMSNNARAVPRVGEGGPAFGEIGVSQYVQARAARVTPTTDANPVLLKPRGDGESQVVVHGEAVGHYAAGEYYDRHWERARAAARASYERLAATYDVVVAEGAGSIAEINLHDRDLANVETARFADADVLLVADIERGGVFAALVGTLELLPDDLRERVVGAVITKFRGDRSILDPGVAAFEERTGVPVLGVLPYDDPGLPAEDSVSLPSGERVVLDGADGASADAADGATATGDGHGAPVTVAVPRLPRISNFTDLEPLAAEPGVAVAFVPLGEPLDADAVVLPGTKNAVDDLLAAREAGLDDALADFDGPVVGLCGGYQLLGERLTGAHREGTGDRETVPGFGLLPVETRFAPEKAVRPVTRELRAVGPLAGAAADRATGADGESSSGPTADASSGGTGRTHGSPLALGAVSGYEIHHGRTTLTGPAERPFDGEGAAAGRVLGTYLHGLFENRVARDAFLDAAFVAAGRPRPPSDATGSAYDRAAALLTDHADVERLLSSVAIPDGSRSGDD